MKYVTLAVPSALAQIANSICCAFEPDSGINPETYNAFATKCSNSTKTEFYLAYGAEVKDWLADAVMEWKDVPTALWTNTVQEYASRWPELTPPTITECEQFCERVLISQQYGVLAGLVELGLELSTVTLDL